MTTTTIALVETMPEHHRASHRAANNWGRWPQNGAQREWMHGDAASKLVDNDEDGYDSIVKEAEVRVGMRVIAVCTVPEDSDEGRVAEITDHGMTVAWDSGISTPVGWEQVRTVNAQHNSISIG